MNRRKGMKDEHLASKDNLFELFISKRIGHVTIDVHAIQILKTNLIKKLIPI